jgi:hypothetical protein
MISFIQQFKHLRSFLFLYLIIGGLVVYLLSAAIDAVFIYTVEMSPGWCVESMDAEGEYGFHKECFRFKNKIEELKYLHNQTMKNRLSKRFYAMIALASIVTLLLMLLVPSRFFDNGNEFLHHKTEVFASAIFYGFLLSVVMPLLYGAVLPPPIEWFPDEIVAIRQARVELVLKEIIEASKLLSQ